MSAPRSSTLHGLEAQLERRFTTLIPQYQAQVVKSSSSSPNSASLNRELWDTDAIIEFASKMDLGLRRKQERNLRRAAESAIEILKANRTPGEIPADSDSDEFELEKGVEYMEVKETNGMNKSLYSIYNSTTTASSLPPGTILPPGMTPPPTATSTPVNEEVNENKDTNNTNGTASGVKRTLNESNNLANKRKKSAASGSSVNASKEAKRAKTSDSATKYISPTLKLADLGGIDHCIEEVLQLIGMPLRHPEIYLHLGIQPPRGILLHGPPGCGKTMLANAIAGECQVPFINISAPSIVSGMSGESEKKLREVFEEAKDLAPCILFIDEIDAITPKRETAQREMERRIVAQLLTCLDDLSLEKTQGKPVLIIGATNRPDSLDPALRRAGRFDREISMGVPDENARMKILDKMCSKLKLSGDFDFKELAKMTPGYVGADLQALTAEAGLTAVKRIFNDLKMVAATLRPVELENDKEDEGDSEDGMDIDQNNVVTMISTPTSIEPEATEETQLEQQQSKQVVAPADAISTVITNFLSAKRAKLSEAELESLSITIHDFYSAIQKVQPSSKREGFATVPDVNWEDIGALEGIREELRMAIVEPVKRPEVFAKVGITKPMGVLLYGPPGCGKTLLAKAVANESCCNFISVKGPELLNKYVGESERAVRQVFSRAQASSPCVIFFDELDALCPARSSDSESQHSSRLVNTLLTEMDGLQGRKQVYIIGATNRPDMIDPAMLRPGRLDKTLYVDLPTSIERFEILKTLTRSTPLKRDQVDLHAIAFDNRCEGFSGADLAALIREAAVTALRRTLLAKPYSTENGDDNDDDVSVDQSCFEVAFKKIHPSVSAKDKRKFEMLRRRFGDGGVLTDVFEGAEGNNNSNSNQDEEGKDKTNL